MAPTPVPPSRGPRAADASALGTRAETIAGLALMAIAAFLHSLVTRGDVRLPSELFGGDLYYQMGCIRSIGASHDPMASCSTSGALPGYLPLYGTLIAAFGWVTRLDVEHAMMAGSVLLRMLSVGIVWRGARGLFGRFTSLLLAAFWLLAHPGLIARYTDFAAEVVAPLFFFALCRFLLEPSARRAAALGVLVAIAGLTHAVLFAGVLFLTAAAIAIDLAGRGPDASWRRHLAAATGRAAIVAGLSLGALYYWWKPLVVHHGRTSYMYTEWNGGPALGTLAQRLDFSATLLAEWFSPTWPIEPVLTLLAVAGVAIAVARSGDRLARTVGVVGALTLVYLFHFMVTEPLFGFHLVPTHIASILWPCARVLLAGLAVRAALEPRAAHRIASRIAIAGTALLFGFEAFVTGLSDPTVGHRPLHPMYESLQRWVEANTLPGDVFLSSNELSFALSALTGRKVMTTRRAQNDAFLDMDVRNRDAALILYGNDDTLRVRLLDRYGVDYLFWTDEWPSTEFYLDERGQVQNYDDPLLVFQSAAMDSALTRAGVRFVHLEGWVDPALRGERYPRFPITIVTPDNYARPDRPWRPKLDRWLERVWSYDEGERTIAAIYRLRP